MPEDQREEIKQKVDLVELINEYVPLKKTGRNFKALCPFHAEKTPSFIVSPERQIWKCFGCGEGGDAFGFLMLVEGLEFGEALQALAKRAGVRLRRYQPTGEEKTKQLMFEINHLAAEFFHYLLLKHPIAKGALNYILGRGITKDSLLLFKLGFAPDRWDTLQKFLVNKKGYQLQDLEKAGLIISSQKQNTKNQKLFYDRFRGRLMFPLKDHRGNTVGFAGRVLNPKIKDLPAGRQEAKYINTPETLVYHKSDLLFGLTETREAIKKADEAIAVEGELDLISSWQAGIKNVIAIKGSALTENQVRLLSRFTKNICLALDKDIAGDLAAKRGIEIAENLGLAVKVIKIQGGKDPDEVAQKNPLLWQRLVSKAVSVYDYYLDSAFERFGGVKGEEKRKISVELIPIWAKISDEIVKAHYVKKLAERLGVDQEAVLAQMDKSKPSFAASSEFKKEGTNDQVNLETKLQEVIEEYLFSLAFQSDHWDWLTKKKIARLVKTRRFSQLLEVVNHYFKRYQTNKSERLAKMLPAELSETFDHLYLTDLADILDDEDKIEREKNQILWRLEELEIRQQQEKLTLEIRALEKKETPSKEEKQHLDKLTADFRDFSEKLSAIRDKKE